MAWAERALQSGSTDKNVSSNSTTIASGFLAGITAKDRVIVVVVTSRSGSLSATTKVTDNLGNTYSRDGGVSIPSDGGFFGDLSVWSAPVNTTGSVLDSITATFATTDVASAGISITEYSGLSTEIGSAAVDVSAFGTGIGTNSPASGNTAATGAANELNFGAFGDQGTNNTMTAGAGFTLFVKDDSNTNGETLAEDRDSSGSGIIQTSSASASGTPTWGMGCIVYKLSGAAAAVTPSRAIRIQTVTQSMNRGASFSGDIVAASA